MPDADDLTEPSGPGPRVKADRQRWAPAMIAVTLVLLAVVGYAIYLSVDGPNVSGGLVSYDPATDGVLPVTVEIARDSGIGVECEIVAVDDRQIIVGQLTLEIPPGQDTHLRVDAEVPLEGDGIAAKLHGCRAA